MQDVVSHQSALITSGLISILVSYLLCNAMLLYSDIHSHLSLDHADSGPQKTHVHPTPRIGGIAIFSGIALSLLYLSIYYLENQYALFIICALPAFLGGIAEDVTKIVNPLSRLLLTFLSALMAILLMDAKIERLDIPGLDYLLSFSLFRMAVTVGAVGGVSHSINLIDGYNGLAAVSCILIFMGLGYVSFINQDIFLFNICVIAALSTLGFLFWNYPQGLIFAGDGGAYLLGFIIAEISVLLVSRHQNVSPWFPLLVVFYPVWETIFVMYRRVFVSNKAVGQPDAIHMHQLISKRLIRPVLGSRNATSILRCNYMTSPYLWVMTIITVIPGTILWDNSVALMICAMAYVVLYVWLYTRIVRFKSPKWLMLRKR